MNDKKFSIFLWGLIVAGVAAIILAIVGIATRAPGGDLAVPVNSSDQAVNIDSAKAILVEYSDFQCPACAYFYLQVKQLQTEFGGDLGFVYRHFPLSQHQYAEPAAIASEAAGRQGKFWQMYDLIFDNQNVWSQSSDARAIFMSYAENLKLDMERFKSDIDSGEIKNKINADYSSGERSGVNSTPTFFLNGKKIQNPTSIEAFKKIISDEINKPNVEK